MANSNIINAVFGSGICAVTTSAFRANYGMVLRFSGIDLPTAFEVDFSNYDVMGRDSITAIGQNGEVQIPDDLWDSGLNIYAYVYLHPTDDSGVTVYTVTIPVLGRPNRTEETPTPHEQTVIEQAISALNDAVEQTAADVVAADASASAAAQSEANAATSERSAAASASAALASKNAAESASQSATESASGAAESAESAATSADAAAESASEAQASAEQAEQSAQSIEGDVERAEQAATTATNKATEAATSAATANGAAQTATGKAAQAEQSATAAANSASAAATSASNADSSATAAQTAQTAAETAQGKAEDAQAAAEAAAQSVSESATQIAKNTDNFASAFSASTTYAIGDYCIHEGTLYRFINEHTGAWSASDVEATNVGGEIGDVKSAVNNNESAIDDIGIYVQSENIYSGSYTPNKKLDANGTLVDVSDYGTTDYIPVIGDKTVYLGYENSAQYHSTQAGLAARYAIYDKYHNLVEVNTNAWVSNITIPSNGRYLRFTASNTRLSGNYTVNYDALQSIYTEYSAPYWKPKNEAQVEQNTADIIANKADADAKIEAINDEISNENSYDKAVGGMFETATTNDAGSGYIAYKQCDKHQRRDYQNKNVVAVNHDDLQPSDYLATRRIYNKFGFKANFNFILLPFTSKAQQDEMVKNVKALIADGHDLGLHAIMGASFWWMNKMWDMRPNFSTTFNPSLSEIKTVVANNKNVFGYTINSTKKFSDVGFANIPSQVTNTLVADATNTDYIYLMAHYNLYTMYLNTVTGLDLDGNTQNWTGLKWLEYWYNELIDDSLGYSKNSQSLEANYIDDYAVPDGTTASSSAYNAQYPDAEHLLNGKVVRFDDTTNSHYSDSAYQKVGYFKKGLFKGAVSCCNYEVVDRCIEIAKAFCKHYFGIDRFTNFGRHGVRYANCTWKDSGSVPFDNRDMSVLTGEVGAFYHSRTGKFMTEHDILLDQGIMMTNHYHPLTPIFESQIGLYYGQNGIRSPFFNHIYKDSGDIDYLALFGTSTSGYSETMDYSTFISYMGGRDNWLKFAYETAGQTFTKPDGTGSMYMFNKLKQIINHIRATIGTGKIPVLSLDTIKLNAATMAGIELLCQYCYANGIDIVPMEKARLLANSNGREALNNYFPNPSFNQSVLNMFGGSSTSADAYMPDGWFMNFLSGAATYSVESDTVNGNTERIFTVSTVGDNDYLYLQSRAYGLPAGEYAFSVWAKQTSTTPSKGRVNVYKKKNSDYLERYYGDGSTKYSPEQAFQLTTEWSECTATIIIPEPHRNMPSDTVAGQYAGGYEDNVNNITFEIYISNVSGGNSVSIALPKFVRN